MTFGTTLVFWRLNNIKFRLTFWRENDTFVQIGLKKMLLSETDWNIRSPNRKWMTTLITVLNMEPRLLSYEIRRITQLNGLSASNVMCCMQILWVCTEIQFSLTPRSSNTDLIKMKRGFRFNFRSPNRMTNCITEAFLVPLRKLRCYFTTGQAHSFSILSISSYTDLLRVKE
jgi:hypothetical protein